MMIAITVRTTKIMIVPKIGWKLILCTESMLSFNYYKTLGCLLFPFYGCGYWDIAIKLIAHGHVTSK